MSHITPATSETHGPVTARVITQEEAWEAPSVFAAPHCRRCKGRGVVWVFMAVCNEYAQNALNLCTCITRKKGYRS